MARIPDGWVFIPRLKKRKKTEIEVEVERKELVFCEHCIYSGWKIEKDGIAPEYYCHRRTEPEPVDAEHFCRYGEERKE